MFKKLESKKRNVQIAEQIIASIQDSTYKPGEKLPPERMIAEQIGVSRPSVREALCALEMVGLLESRVGDGTYVRSTDPLSTRAQARAILEMSESPFEVLDARRILESTVATIAAERAEQADLELMQDALSLMKQATQEKDDDAYLHANIDFHIGVVKGAKNSYLESVITPLIRTMEDRLSRAMRKSYLTENEQGRNAYKIHERIFRAIRNGDSRAAKKEMEEHFRDVETYLSEDYKSGGDTSSENGTRGNQRRMVNR